MVEVGVAAGLGIKAAMEAAGRPLGKSMDSLKKTACLAIDNASKTLFDLSQQIWKKPELAYNEYHAHEVLTGFLDKQGFQVEKSYHLETAFRATFGSPEKPHISVLCEYDALPDIGHACGHNLIAEVGVAAGLGIKAAMESAGRPLGKLTVLGTPAEEAGGGKIDLIKKGVFDDMDVSMMAHPSNLSDSRPLMLAMTEVYVTFHGKASHAAAFPWEGVNALDAAVMTYNNVSCMRQQMKPTWRLHGVITNGGAKPNIIPEKSQVHFYLRTPTAGELKALMGKFEECACGAASATGCQINFEWDPKPYANIMSNSTVIQLYEENCRQLGVTLPELSDDQRSAGSTDMGNVSHVLPGIHPEFDIGTAASEHSAEFCGTAGTKEAQENTLNTAKALAMTALDLYCTEGVIDKAKSDFAEDLKRDSL